MFAGASTSTGGMTSNSSSSPNNASSSSSSSHIHHAIVHSPSQSSSSGAGSSGSAGPRLSNVAAANSQAPMSRKKIISKSQEHGLNDEELMNEDEDDVWYDKESLFRDHLQEIMEKWASIDDPIWAKIICMERNRRVAKAYARVSPITIGGGKEGFDSQTGRNIGLAGFDNAKRHPETAQAQTRIGKGVKLRMDQAGNILVKPLNTSLLMFVQSVTGSFQEENSFSPEVIRLQGRLDSTEPHYTIFDNRRFIAHIKREQKKPFPDRRKLELQCIANIAFVQNEADLLETPCWIMLINIVALDMLKTELPRQTSKSSTSQMRGRLPRVPGLMENVQAQRYLSTPHDEHYPRLLQQQMHSMSDATLAEGNEYGDDFDDRASVSTYNFIPGYRPASSLLHGDYEMLHPATLVAANGAPTRSFRPPLHPHAQESIYQHYQDAAYYAELAAAGYTIGPNGALTPSGYRTPLGHAATEPVLRMANGGPSGMATGRSFTTATPSLQRFVPNHRHSRSYDSGLESDMTSCSDESDLNRWTSYSRGVMLHNRASQYGQPAITRLTEWE